MTHLLIYFPKTTQARATRRAYRPLVHRDTSLPREAPAYSPVLPNWEAPSSRPGRTTRAVGYKPMKDSGDGDGGANPPGVSLIAMARSISRILG